MAVHGEIWQDDDGQCWECLGQELARIPEPNPFTSIVTIPFVVHGQGTIGAVCLCTAWRNLRTKEVRRLPVHVSDLPIAQFFAASGDTDDGLDNPEEV